MFDKTAPRLDNVTAFTTPTHDNVTSYTFSSDEAGTIDIVGDCSGSVITATAVADNNTIIFDALADGTYDNCIITVTDNASNKSDNLSVSSFTIGRLTPALAEITPVPTPTMTTSPVTPSFRRCRGRSPTAGAAKVITVLLRLVTIL